MSFEERERIMVGVARVPARPAGMLSAAASSLASTTASSIAIDAPWPAPTGWAASPTRTVVPW